MTLLTISFIAGMLTVLAPCILPLLPVILGGAIHGGGKYRAYTIIAALAVSLISFTFLLKVSTVLITVPEQFWKSLSGSIIVFFGLVYLFPALWARIPFVGKMFEQSNNQLSAGMQKKNMWGDILVGAALGPVFATCSPTYFLVLATILPVSLALGFLYIAVYTLGLCLALLFIALLGQRLMPTLGLAADPHGWFKRFLGVLFLIVGLAVFMGYDKKLERAIVEKDWFSVTQLEYKLLETLHEEEVGEPALVAVDETTATDIEEKQMPAPLGGMDEKSKEVSFIADVSTKPATLPVAPAVGLKEGIKQYVPVPEITSPAGYVNTNNLPFTISEHVGRSIILVDFWTYSCINCQRTLPYLNKWHATYGDKGLVIIGIHTPEFAYERVKENVEEATRRFGVKYPVVLDNSYATWGAFKNNYWPRKYLINMDGDIVYDHIGEGAYAEIETKIQELLLERTLRNLGNGAPTQVNQ